MIFFNILTISYRKYHTVIIIIHIKYILFEGQRYYITHNVEAVFNPFRFSAAWRLAPLRHRCAFVRH